MKRALATIARICLLPALLTVPGAVTGGEDVVPAADAIQGCLDCHDYGADSPVHQVLLGSHGIEGDAADMAERRGCLDCHGESAAHGKAPRRESPDVSFGPRWSSSAGAQDKRCLDCHEKDVAAKWRNTLHMLNGLTCVTCHDIHVEEDPVLFSEQQVQVCTTCHKAQRSGIHDLGNAEGDPPCSVCHNPHDHESATMRMRENQSAGCTGCHDQAGMSTLAAMNKRAARFHRVMDEPQRSCIDCHGGIAHAPEDSVSPFEPEAVRGRSVTLFYPGSIDGQWLRWDHPGSQSLRQGTACRRCHRGDEAAMGAALAGDFTPASRDIAVLFALHEDELQIDISWEGPADDHQLALMWGAAGHDAFRRGGCFSACHTEGADADFLWGKWRRQADDWEEYLPGTMGAPGTAGFRAELWRIPLGAGQPDTALVTDSINAQFTNEVRVERQYRDGRWAVQLRLELDRAGSGVHFSRDRRYTFGVALHGADNRGREHWVSLPLSLGFGAMDTDFTAQ